MTEDHHQSTDSGEPAQRFVAHFEPILCETAADERILEGLAAHVRRFERTDGAVSLTIEGPYEHVDVGCTAPFDGDVADGVPDSYATLADYHNGIAWEAGGGGVFGFPGLLDDGALSAFSWDPSYLDHSGNEEYADALAAEGLDLDDVRGAFGVGQNWIVFDPLGENARGEPTMAFVSHGTCELERIPAVEALGAGQVLLRLFAFHFIEDDSLDPVYA